jgi:hypothetical protein
MKSFNDIREKTLTPTELKKREEIAKAMERDNPGMDMGKKMAIATATAKRVAEARASISVGSADKKPENFRDQDGKMKVRMVPVKKTVVQYEAVDYEKLTQLARFGLVDKGNVQKLIAAFKKMEDGKVLAPPQRELMMNVLTDLTGIVTGDTQMFQKAKKAVKEETLDESLSPTQLEKLKKQYATTGDRISTDAAMKMNAMIKKFDKPALISLYKANIKWLSTSAMTQLISKHGMKAADLKAVSEEVESITELTAEEKRLINTMYDKKGNLTDIGKKVMDHGKKNRFPHNTSASQGKMMSGKSTMYSEDTQIEEAVDKVAIQKQIDQTEKFMKSFTGNTSSVKMKKYALQTKLNKLKAQLAEEVELDEISMGKMAAYADKAVKSRNDAKAATYSADSNRRDKAQKTIVKRKAGADNYNKKMWGYSNVAPTKESVDDVQIDEARLSQQQRDRLDDLIFNVMITGNIEYDGKDNPTRHLKTIEKEFGPKVAKQVEAGMDIKNWGRDNRSSGMDSLALRKKSRISASGKMNKQDAVALGKRIMQDKSFGGLTKKVKLPEEAQIDEKTGVFGGDYTSKDHMMGMKNFMSIRDKKAKQRDAEHQAQDPKMAKMGYAKHMMDMDKAKSKAAKKGVNPSKTSRSDYETRNGMNPNRKLPEDTQIDEARPSQRHPLEGHPYHKKTNAELEYIGKDAHKAAQAMKSHNPSAEGKYLDQANDSATVRHFRKTSGTPDWYKKKYGHSMKEEAQIDEMGAFMSSPLPTPMSMRKDPPMTKPLMLTKRMNTAATLIKKAGNTPKLPEATYSDTGWQKPKVKKDQSGNVIKDKNVAKTLAKSGLRRTKDLEAAQKAKEFTFSRVKK